MSATEEGSSTFKERVISGSAIITLLTAVLFLSGWIYLSEYYFSFGVYISALDLPVYAFLLASISPIAPILSKFVLLVRIWLIIGLLLVLMWSHSRRFRAFFWKLRNGRVVNSQTPTWVDALITSLRGSIWFLVGLCFALLPCGWALKSAEKDAESNYEQPRIKTVLTFKTGEQVSISKEFVQVNAEGGLRLLTQTKDFIVVFVKREINPESRGSFFIPAANLIAVHNEVLKTSR